MSTPKSPDLAGRKDLTGLVSAGSRFGCYVVIWSDEHAAVPDQDEISRLERVAHDHDGTLLALGPVLDVVAERQSKTVPAWVAIAGFPDDGRAAAWFEPERDRWAATAMVVPAHTEPVWWPDERKERPAWSTSMRPPPERLGLFVSVWVDITDLETFRDYATHFRWTVEANEGASLGSAPRPTVLGGGLGPAATPLLAFRDEDSLRAWYDCADYLPYRARRHSSSNCTTAAVKALHHRQF